MHIGYTHSTSFFTRFESHCLYTFCCITLKSEPIWVFKAPGTEAALFLNVSLQPVISWMIKWRSSTVACWPNRGFPLWSTTSGGATNGWKKATAARLSHSPPTSWAGLFFFFFFLLSSSSSSSSSSSNDNNHNNKGHLRSAWPTEE